MISLRLPASLKSVSLLALAGAVSQAVGFLYRVLLARLVPAEHLGLFQLVMPVYSVLSAVCLSGLSVCSVRLTAKYRALGAFGTVRALLNRLVGIFLLLFSGACLVLVPGSGLLAERFLGTGDARGGILLLLPLLLFTGFENIHKNYFHGAGHVGPPALSEVLEQLLRTGLVCGLLAAVEPVTGRGAVICILAGMVLCEIWSGGLMTVWARKSLGSLPPAGPKTPPGELDKSIRSLAAPIAATNLLGAVTGSLCSVMLPGRLELAGLTRTAALEQYGVLFSMAAPLAMLPGALLGPLNTVLVPRLCGAAALGETGGIRRRIRKALAAVSYGMLPCAALMYVLGPTLLKLVFRTDRGAEYMAPLAVLLALSGYQGVLGTALSAIGGQREAAGANLLGGAAHLALSWVLTARPGVGLLGYLWADGLVTAASICYFALRLRARCGLRLTLRPLLEPGLAALCAGLWSALAAKTLADAPAAAMLPLCVILCAAIYLGLLKAQRA